MLLAQENVEDVQAFIEQERSRHHTEELLESLHKKSLSTAPNTSESDGTGSESSDDEEDFGLKCPIAYKLEESEFESGLDYVKSFVSELKKLHKSDVHNEERKAQSLGRVYHTQNLQPECFRGKLSAESLFLTAIIPVLKETYKSDFSNRKPSYTLIESEFLAEKQILGVITPKPCGKIPPVTVCQQTNDLREGLDSNFVFTYVFSSGDQNSNCPMPDPQIEISTIKN